MINISLSLVNTVINLCVLISHQISVFNIKQIIYKYGNMTSTWRHWQQRILNFSTDGITVSSWTLPGNFGEIWTFSTEIWKKKWVGVFFWTQCTHIWKHDV